MSSSKTARQRATSQRLADQRLAGQGPNASAAGAASAPLSSPRTVAAVPPGSPPGQPTGAAVPPRRPPGLLWPSIAGLIISVAGLAIAAYLTYDHYSGSVPLNCPDTGIINCLRVTTSSYSIIFGVPVALLGLIFFAVMIVLQLPRMWASADPRIRGARLAWAVIGMGTAVWLVYAELFRINNICLYCTAVHVLTLLVFATTAIGTAFSADNL